jgi:site-specific DNA recombinase
MKKSPPPSNQQRPLRYLAYLRKSSESQERQAPSIDSQRDMVNEYFPGVEIVEYLAESRSAFKFDNRDVFEDMLERIENGEADGIVAWHPNRLSRNAVDAGKIIQRLRNGSIKDLKFCSYPFDNSPIGVMMLQIALSQSEYESAAKSVDVKRGVLRKAKQGIRPGLPPEGYRNDIIKKVIKIEAKKFALVRRMWDLMLAGTHTVPKVTEIANEDWGFRTRRFRSKKIGDKPLASSTAYRMFSNPFYAGYVVHNGEWYQGQHKAMVTLEEYDRVQDLLGKKGRPRPKTHDFAYTGFIKCGDCGCSITAEPKTKKLKTTGETVRYVYYHCTRKKRHYPCSQRKQMREEELERQVDALLSPLTILPRFKQWALEVLNNANDSEIAARAAIQENQTKTLRATQIEFDNLTKMRYREEIDAEEFAHERKAIKGRLERLKKSMEQTEERAEKWVELTEQTFVFATYARAHFNEGDIQTRKEILMTLGQNPVIKDGKLLLQSNNWLQPITNGYPALRVEYEEVRTGNYASPKLKTAALAAVHNTWLGR